MDTAFEYLKWWGIEKEDDYPYNKTDVSRNGMLIVLYSKVRIYI